MSAITTHVLDTSIGKPAAGVPIRLEIQGENKTWELRGHGVTDADGRLKDLLKDVPLSVGLAHWDEVMDVRHLERLRRILDLLAARGEDVAQVRPACYSGAGFTTELRAAEARGDVVLVDLDRLYHGV